MKIAKLLRSFAMIAIAVMLFATPLSASADTYQILNLGNDAARFFYGLNDSGTVVLDLNASLLCGGSDNCYQTFVGGLSTGFSSTAPALAYDNGTPCTPGFAAGWVVLQGVCNNGREASTGYLSAGEGFPDVFTGPDPVADFLAKGGGSSIFMNNQGDIVWDDIYSENFFEAIDLTTDQVPEPSGFLLLGTGLIAGAGTMRRRLLQSSKLRFTL